MLSVYVVQDIADNSQERYFSAMLLSICIYMSICFLYDCDTGYKSWSSKCLCNYWSNTAVFIT